MGILRFRLLSYPVQIQPGFWLLVLLLGMWGGMTSAERFVTWAVVVLVSILAHELGHAAMARRYGQEPVITLHMLGGATSWMPTHDIGRGRRILVTLAGPFSGFALAFVGYLVLAALSGQQRVVQGEEQSSLLVAALELLVLANVFWSVLNLLPVLPFDGGQVMAAALGDSRRQLAAGLSLVFGLVIAAVLFKLGFVFGALIFAMGGVSNFMAVRNAASRRQQAPPAPERLEEVLTQARIVLDAGQHRQAAAMGRAVAAATDDPRVRARGLEIAAWGALLDDDVPAARACLADFGPLPVDAMLEAAVYEKAGDVDRAAARLLAARRGGDTRPELAAHLVRVLLEARRYEEAVEVTTGILDATDAAEVRKVADVAFDGGAPVAAAELRAALFDLSRAASDAYDAARGFARAGDRDRAIEWLERAISSGLGDAARARDDGDLAQLSGDARFEAALAAAET